MPFEKYPFRNELSLSQINRAIDMAERYARLSPDATLILKGIERDRPIAEAAFAVAFRDPPIVPRFMA